ncbi:Do family serine endopeptidase [Horticoccus sp. 23ND18S-11]|uniref:Do family serine endopeptidase n=1 Tax=Horticoccus sp. 23ND18S-11 TaxID=3391832 RepID=UPI0039C9D399
MKSKTSPSPLLLALIFALTCAGTASLTLYAAEVKPAKPGKANKAAKAETAEKTAPADEKRAPLQLSVDRKPINRDASDRISYAPIVKRTASSVVYVYSSKTVRGQDMSQFFNDPRLRRFFDLPGVTPPTDDEAETPRGRNENRNNRKSTPTVPRGGSRNRTPDQTQQGLGSGVVITADGYVLTNNHVVEDADEVRVSIGESNKRYVAKVVGRDALTDLAVLKIDATNLSPATFGDSDQLQVGDVVLAIGNPFGVGQSVSRGIVSALSRGVGIGPLEDFIQTDAAINPGNSGGALLDTDGRVVGINTAILSRSGGFAGVGFAIPINLVRSVAEQIVNTGRVERGFLGVAPQDLTEDLTAQFGADKGALISQVTEDSPASRAGLKAGDVIIKVNATEIRDARHLLLTISQVAPGTDVSLEFLRDGKTETAKAKLARRNDEILAKEDSEAATKDVGVLNGVGVGDITAQMRDQLQLPARMKGALITSVDPDSPSGKQGLREGDVILELDKKPVFDAASAVKLSEEIKGPRVLVLVWRDGRSRFLAIDESK